MTADNENARRVSWNINLEHVKSKQVANIDATRRTQILILNFLQRKLGKKKQKFRLWRQKFLSGLSTTGLDIEEVSYKKLRFQKYLIILDLSSYCAIAIIALDWDSSCSEKIESKSSYSKRIHHVKSKRQVYGGQCGRGGKVGTYEKPFPFNFFAFLLNF